MTKTNRITVQFNTEDEEQKRALKFLDKCGYKKNKIIAIMISELIEKYGFDIDELTSDEIKEFASGYEYIKQSRVNVQAYPPVALQAPRTEKNKETNNDIKTEKKAVKGTNNDTVKVSSIDMDRANLALSAFGL